MQKNIVTASLMSFILFFSGHFSKKRLLESPESNGGIYWVDAKIIDEFKPK
jgi:hypothetical protein